MTKFTTFLKTSLAGLSLAAAAAFAAAPASAQAPFPSKPIILVAPGTIGGGADVQLRLAAAAIEASKKISEPAVVLNRGAGGSQEAYVFTKSKTGDAHYVLAVAPQFLTYPMLGPSGYQFTDFTPIANLVFDPSVVVVRADSPYKTLADFINAAKAAPDTLTVGGGQVGAQDSQGHMAIQAATGTKLRYVAFAGGADLLRNVLGGNLNAAVGNPSDFMGSVEGGQIRVLAVLDEERNPAPALKAIPTAREQGFNVTNIGWRGWVAPANISAAQREFLAGLAKAVLEDATFVERYLVRFGMRPGYISGDAFGKYMAERDAEYRVKLKEVGLLK
jgi:putative tricarboxylic transport membrane protein